jgi:hypothetical protein
LDDGTASLPLAYIDLAGFGNLISISASGFWGKHGNVESWTGPEGKGASDANISRKQYGVFGISLLDAPKQLLVGVFVSDAKPDPSATPPEAPVIRDTDDLITTPALNQAFGIGASLESIVVPDGATKLCFGMHDGLEWSNNGGSVEVTVTSILSVDIKPGSCPNPLNVKSKGVLPVAVLGSELFDVIMIDPATVGLSREGVVGDIVSPLRWTYEDVATPFEGDLCDCHTLGPDGHLDLTLKFDMPELVEKLKLDEVAGETIPLTLTGSLKEEFGGTPIRVEDCISVLQEKGPQKP